MSRRAWIRAAPHGEPFVNHARAARARNLAATPSRAAILTFAPLAVAVLVAVDTLMTVQRVGAPPASELLAFVVVSLALGTVVSVPFLLLRRELHARAARLSSVAPLWHAAIVALDVYLFVRVASYETVIVATAGERAAIVIGAGLGCVAARELARRFPGLQRSLALAVAIGALATACLAFSPRQYDRTRLALDLVALAAFTWVATQTWQVTRRRALAVGALCLLCIALAEPWIRSAHVARRFVHHDAPHARSMRYLLLPLFDWDRDGAPLVLGGIDCDPRSRDVYPGARELAGDGVDQNCDTGDGPTDSLATAHAFPLPAPRTPDVLLISIDALRADAVHLLARTLAVIGPHVIMTRAVSPAPRTLDSLPATLRGRPMRMIALSRHPILPVDAPVHDTHPTLGDALARLGYRTFAAPTHRYLDEASRVAAGFAYVETETFAHTRDTRQGLGTAKPIVRAPEVMEALLHRIGSAPSPFVAWTHLMEAHHPYRWGERGLGPVSMEGYRHALRDLDARLAEFLRKVTWLRGRPPLVVLWGDHGEEFGEHGGVYHATTVYAEQARVGFVIGGPGVPNARIDAPVATTAIPATVLDLLGAAPEPSFVEASLYGCMSGVAGTCPEVAVTELRYSGRFAIGYTTATHRLLVNPVFRVEQLFDSRRDPYEHNDIVSSAPSAAQRLRAIAHRWNERH